MHLHVFDGGPVQGLDGVHRSAFPVGGRWEVDKAPTSRKLGKIIACRPFWHEQDDASEQHKSEGEDKERKSESNTQERTDRQADRKTFGQTRQTVSQTDKQTHRLQKT